MSSRKIHRYEGGGLSAVEDVVSVEAPLQILVDDVPIAVLMRTPGDDEVLAAGFVFTEAIVKKASDVAHARHCLKLPSPQRENTVRVMLRRSAQVDLASVARSFLASSSCGVCGKTTLASVFLNFLPLESDLCVAADVITQLAGRLRGAQREFDSTGGLHAAGLFRPSGELLRSFEDVGRHNAVDKLVGSYVLEGRTPPEGVLVVSGRASFEIVQKALAARIAMVVAVSAPTSLAVELAEASEITLIGFARGARFNTYTGVSRVQGSVDGE